MSGPTLERESRPPVRASRHHGGRFALLALAVLLAIRLPLPWLAIAVVLTVAADWEGILTARAIARERRGRGLLVWCVCGIVAISLVGLAAAASLALYPITYPRQECLRRREHRRGQGGLPVRVRPADRPPAERFAGTDSGTDPGTDSGTDSGSAARPPTASAPT